ncbi:telomere-binding protein 1-like isoform X2 [Lotus japonicus]|uniref:telomere-binding protein 1-like isoform X2 n=1 Tax=Lotus japonicus TaxID=34305 RepID=UPI00258D35C3|nr:telomere-binding protein 1-like isoform X2 [Lotus japonicus]
MVLQKRLDYGFNGYQAPATPRAVRSTRRRAKFQTRAQDNEMCAFELLATVAGKFLLEKENTALYSETSSEKDQHEFPHQDEGHSSGTGKIHDKIEDNDSQVRLGSSGCPEDSLFKLDGDTSKVKDELHKFEKVPIGNGVELCSFEDLLGGNPPALISLGDNTKLSGSNDIPCSSLSHGSDNVPVVSRDDDENSSWCTHPSTKTKSFRPKKGIYDNRIGKILASKFRKVAEKSKDVTLPNNDGKLKRTYCSKNFYRRQSSQMNVPFKKRKLLKCRSISNSNRFISRGIYYSPENVKLRIKSFRVPELFIEVPETATVGSLKRTVMDALTAVLGGGLGIGVVLQGKKVRDDSITLLQTGISQDKQLDALGFTLEPNSSQSLPIVCAAQSLHDPIADTPQPVLRYPSSPAVIHRRTQDNSDLLLDHQLTTLGNLVENDHGSVPLAINSSVDKGRTDSKELITVPEMDKEELASATVLQKSIRAENVQRRIRRPFSVGEVEALVQAVEELGIGRWRDVKLLAFENAEHRTYVDLKDKWKTLVHTARISPQQRRGEPVPQELLDRVLTAQAYWSNKELSPSHGFVDGVGALVSDLYY